MQLTITSKIAYDDFLRKGKKERHHAVILKALEESGPASNWGISKLTGLSYHQVARRTSELRRKGLIYEVCKSRDTDGALRMFYTT